MRWQDLEIEVRSLAESIWAATAAPELIGGVKWDNVLKIRPDYWILVEVSKQSSLTKLREDLAKFQLVKPGLMAKSIFAECYFVTSGEHSSLIESGKIANVEVHDIHTFANKFIGSNHYIRERSGRPFGSAVNPDSGEKDDTAYAPTAYVDPDGKSYSISEISRLLEDGRRIVLVGEFGTGKSRCLMQVFEEISSAQNTFSPIAINLRDNWGYKRLAHIIQNHLDMLGLGQYTMYCTRISGHKVGVKLPA